MASEKNVRDRDDGLDGRSGGLNDRTGAGAPDGRPAGSGGSENREYGGTNNGNSANDDKKYTFIQEKIVPKKRKKLKRFFTAFLCTVFLACIFGIVARAAFICSEPWMEKFLGKTRADGKQPVVLPTGEPDSVNGAPGGQTGENSDVQNGTHNGGSGSGGSQETSSGMESSASDSVQSGQNGDLQGNTQNSTDCTGNGNDGSGGSGPQIGGSDGIGGNDGTGGTGMNGGTGANGDGSSGNGTGGSSGDGTGGTGANGNGSTGEIGGTVGNGTNGTGSGLDGSGGNKGTSGDSSQSGMITGSPLPGDGSGIGLPSTEPGSGAGGGSGIGGSELTEAPETDQKIEADITDFISIYSDVKKLATKVSSSILNITAVTSGVDWFNDPYESRKTTTGIVIADNGTELLLLASLDKIQEANLIEVEISASLSVEASVLDYDSDVNLAIVAVPLSKIPEATLKLINRADLGESYTITTGSPIMALGSPNGHAGSIELGIITSKGSSAYIVDNRLDLFNTSITDNEYSDGVIVNMQGQIIGIITHTLKEGMNEDISTAIGISKIMPIIQRLVNQKDRIYFGIQGEDIPKNILKQAGITGGIYVNEVEAGSPALEAGIKNGDMIVEVGGASISSMTNFYNTISSYNVKDTVKVKVRRQSQGSFKDVEVTVVLAKKTR